ncbi:MAG: Txe/YoeB family addiction module toxin [Prolixibacteraceae bacterium]|nr:Txe/YoeB family addiction module toxin [Prolixibacteraceae bacterium]
MEIKYKTGALDDIEFWKQSGNKKIQKRITALIKSIALTPETGIGKPEKLKEDLSGYWSRRINKEHRLIYKLDYTSNVATIFSLKGHYE